MVTKTLHGHLTDNKQSRVGSDAALVSIWRDAARPSGKLELHWQKKFVGINYKTFWPVGRP